MLIIIFYYFDNITNRFEEIIDYTYNLNFN